MTKEIYEKLSTPFIKRKKLVKSLNIMSKVLTLVVYISYPSLLIFLFFTKSPEFLRITLVPLISFIFVTILRKIINRPRPYEVLDIKPLIQKEKNGESMPSRHVFSVFIIAIAFLYFSPLLSIPFFLIGILMSAIRIIGGVHYPSDVIIAIIIAVLSGLLGFYIIK